MKEKSIIQQNLKKIIGVIVVSVFAIITIYTVFRGSGISLNELTASLKEASWEGILLASVSMLGFIYFEGEALRVLVRHMGYPAKRSHGFVYSAADVYFSAITPSASGGQPASAYFMLKDGIAGTAVMAALLLNLIMYTLAILTIGLVDILIFPEVFLNFSIGCRVLIVAGGLALAGLGIIFYLLLRKQALIESVGTFFVRILRMIHCGRLADKLEKKLEVSIEKYSSLVDVIFDGKRMLWKVYILNLLQRLSQIIVTLFSFAALHGDLRKLPQLLATQIYVVMGSNCVPIPGGMGVTDYLMLKGYQQLMSREAAFQLEMLSRGLSFYVCIFVSLTAVLIGYVTIKRKRNWRMKMIGFYDYTVILTYLSLMSGTIGIMLCLNGMGHPYLGMFFLLFSGLCDTFDGKVARSKKDRTTQMKKFGIQIDSLSDLIAFGMLPACIGIAMLRYTMCIPDLSGVTRYLLTHYTLQTQIVLSLIAVLYVLAAMIRLAYFNVMEEEDQNRDETGAKIYTGLPVTSAALIFPAVLLIHMLIRADLTFLYFGVMLITGGLFISKIQIKKPQNKGIATMIFFGAVECGVLIFALKFLKK